METDQIRIWKGTFGTEYTHRCVKDWSSYVPALTEILEGLELSRILEVGCNRGHNLTALSEMFKQAEVIGIEPNEEAVKIARAAGPNVGVLKGDIFHIPLKDAYFDLVFTAAVLIHVSLDDLPAALREIYRSSRRYVLAIEYFADEETNIPYRGHDNLLWKRDFLKHYRQCLPEIRLLRQGSFDESTWAVWQNCHWWLFEKPL